MASPSQPDHRSIAQAIDQLAVAIAQSHSHTPRLLLLGIANGGIELAARLTARLDRLGRPTNHGTLDTSFHRDDIGRHPIPKEFAPTHLPREVNGAVVILVDDVLHSGRTVKAALDELFDHGRPASVELAVLVDRGGRRLPISANYCALTLAAAENEKVIVQLDPRDPANDRIITSRPQVHETAAPRKKKI